MTDPIPSIIPDITADTQGTSEEHAMPDTLSEAGQSGAVLPASEPKTVLPRPGGEALDTAEVAEMTGSTAQANEALNRAEGLDER
ncbi:hypothetical protein ACFP81_09725 [Deinococcus lacus]|uniref:Uncharacterized protein n=1 Tax=Deinococcus lacus TaxID=392561 RepID=A0ABW1YG76_9DEIO